MKSLKNSLSKTLPGMDAPAPHCEKGFFGHVLRSEEPDSKKRFCVAENPVRKNLGACPEEWTFLGEIRPLAARGRV